MVDANGLKQCKLCAFASDKIWHIREHIEKHDIDFKIMCKTCLKKVGKYRLKQHMANYCQAKKGKVDEKQTNEDVTQCEEISTQIDLSLDADLEMFDLNLLSKQTFKIIQHLYIITQKVNGSTIMVDQDEYRSRISEHITLLDGKFHKCNFCTYEARFFSHVFDHVEGIHFKLNGYKFICKFCKQKQNYSSSIKRHLKKCQQVENKIRDYENKRRK